MIKYNDNTINKWYHDGELIKVYYHDAVCYYKLTPSGQTPCFAVVASISQYSDREFEDVFNQADGKWYKLNNLNAYEEYGVYDSTTATTYYEGKLTVDNGYEYQYSGSSWVNVGAVTNKSYRYWMWRSVGQIVGSPTNYIQFSEFDLSVNGSDVSLSYISAAPTGVTNETADKLFDNSTSTKYCADFSSYLTTNYVLFDSTTAIAPTSFSMTTANDSRNTGRYPKDWVLLGSNTSTTNWNDGSWDTVLSGTCGEEMRVNYKRFNYPISGIIEYPVSYTEMQDPPDNVVFSSMTEAEEYECPWVGMTAFIDGDKYVFSGDSQSGYEWVTAPIDYTKEYLTFEPISSAVVFRNSTKTFQYSLDYGSTWTSINTGNTVTVNVGEKMMVKATFGRGDDDNNGNKFIVSGGTWKAYGNVLSLVGSDNYTATTAISSYQLINLFRDCTTLVDVDNLKMPAYTASDLSIRGMFRNCSSLVHVPSDLLSTFTALTSAYCSMGMFEDCSSLLETPIIPDVPIGSYGLWGMFNNCTSLTACTCLLTNSYIGGNKTGEMLNGVNTANGVFYKNPNATWQYSDASIPSGWSIQDYI